MARRPAQPGLDRREQILEAALDVFAEEGFDGATTKEIAARADVTHGLIYFYFPSKEDLFSAAFEHQARRDFAELDFNDERESDDPPDEILRRIVTKVLTILGSPRSMRITRMMMRMSASREQFDRVADKTGEGKPLGRGTAHTLMRERMTQVITNLAECLRVQMARGALRSMDPQLAAELLLGSLSVMMMRRIKAQCDEGQALDDNLLTTIADLWANGLVSTAPTPAEPSPKREKHMRTAQENDSSTRTRQTSSVVVTTQGI